MYIFNGKPILCKYVKKLLFFTQEVKVKKNVFICKMKNLFIFLLHISFFGIMKGVLLFYTRIYSLVHATNLEPSLSLLLVLPPPFLQMYLVLLVLQADSCSWTLHPPPAAVLAHRSSQLSSLLQVIPSPSLGQG